MKNTLAVLSCFLVHFAFAQPIFRNYSNAAFGHMIRLPNNELLVLGRQNYGNPSEVWRLDANGDPVWSATLSTSLTVGLKALSTTQDGYYLASGNAVIGQGQQRPFFKKINTDGQIVSTIYPSVNKRFELENVYPLPNQSFVAVGMSGYTGPYNFAVMRLDNTLQNVIHFAEHQVEADTFSENWQNLVSSRLSADQERLVSITADRSSGTNINSNSYVIQSDVDGQVMWKAPLDYGIRDYVTGLELLADGSVVVTGTTTLSDTSRSRVFITKIDSIGQMVWQHFLEDSSINISLTGNDIVETSAGDLLITAKRSNVSADDILLLLTDADGIEKQRVLLERDNHDDAPGSVVLLDNDMVAVAGWEGYLENAQNLLVLFPLSLLTAIREMAVESPFFRVFPNPFETDLSIQYDHPNASAEALRLEIYSGTGMKIYAGAVSDRMKLQHLPAGVYYFILTDQGLSRSFVRKVVKRW